jgi:glycosyltransferase involved in cell wall biosynthesis
VDQVADDDDVDVQLACSVVALRREKVEVEHVKVLSLLLHDERFSGWKIEGKLGRTHFSLKYMGFCRQKGWDPVLYTFHQDADEKKVFCVDGVGTVKVFPVKMRFPPFLRFGNDHNPGGIVQEALIDRPDLIHFHDYYLFSYPYVAVWLKRRAGRPLVVQLHGYNNGCLRKWFYLPCLLALRRADRILYSYEPEEKLYGKLGVLGKAVKVPVPGVDTGVFRRRKRRCSNRLLYVGRVPGPERAYGEKSPLFLLHVVRRLRSMVRDVGLDVVGDGPGLGHCVEQCRVLGLSDCVSFHGYVRHGDLPGFYEAAGLTVAPIQVYDVDGWFDGMVQESLACGTPVAALKTSGGRPLRGTYGFLLSNNAEKAASEIAGLFQEREMMEQAAAEGSRFVHGECSDVRVAETLRGVWEEMVRA